MRRLVVPASLIILTALAGTQGWAITPADASSAASRSPLAGAPLLTAATPEATNTAATVAATSSPVPAFGHVFVIVGENKGLAQLTASNAPYIINTLEPSSAWMTDYNDVADGSLADYVALTSGQYAACETGGPCGQQAVPSIFSQLGDADWRDWNESMPTACYANFAGSTTTLNPYKPGHNPALYFAGLPCATNDVPAGTTGPNDMSTFNDALAAGAVPKYNFITPNLCEDSYKLCNVPNIVTAYDDFLAKEIPLIEASPAFGQDGVIFATYDEGNTATDSDVTMMSIVGPQVLPGTYGEYQDHYSTLATIEQGLGLPCLANACQATPFPVFGNPAAPAVAITQPAAGSTVSGLITLAGTATGTGSATIASVQVSVDGGTPSIATGTDNWSASLDTTQLADGPHTVTATATDDNSLSSSAAVTVQVSNGAPTTTSCPAVAQGMTEYSANVSLESSQSGWTGFYNRNSAVTRTQPTGGSFDGTWALRIGIKSGSGQGGVNNVKPLWITSTAADTTYTAGSFVRAGTSGEKVSLTLTEKTPSGTVVRSHTTTITLTDSNWHPITDSYTTSQVSGNTLRYSLHGGFQNSGQYVFADCLSVQAPS